jgi:enamine deaminase RidA (YjgF/YER057c/UK114 family)
MTAAPAPLANYSDVRRSGQQLYVAGTTARLTGGVAGVTVNASGAKTYDVGAQTDVILQKIDTALRPHGSSLGRCVALTCYLVDMADFAAFNEAYNRWFPPEVVAPTRTCVAVLALPHPDMRVEITAIAGLPERDEGPGTSD